MYHRSAETITEKEEQIEIEVENGSVETKNAELISFDNATYIRANGENATNTKHVTIESYNETEILHGSNEKDSENVTMDKESSETTIEHHTKTNKSRLIRHRNNNRQESHDNERGKHENLVAISKESKL